MIVILAAMKEELDAVVANIESPMVKLTPFGELYEGTIKDKKVICAQSGVGKTVAAATTTYLIERFPVTTILNIGTAGGLSTTLSVTDVVVADKVSYHDLDLRAFNYPTGWNNTSFVFFSDTKLVELAKQQANQISSNLFVGPIVSGDQFVSERSQFEKIIETFDGVLAVDMEACAIAHVASLYHLPFAIVRSISDIVVEDDNQMSFLEYIKKAAIQSAACVVGIVEKI